ncbi:MAG: hypothetical protein WC552_05615 [Candidatus Omnitrophota bacterium]
MKNRFKFFMPLSGLATVFLVVLGVYLRISQYLLNRSLWLDEIVALEKISHFSIRELAQCVSPAQSLVYPVGYLAFQKWIIHFWGTHEYVLRLSAVLSGSASVILFAFLASRILEKKARIIALVFFAFSYSLIFHSTEFKPYASDVLITVALLLYGLSLTKEELTIKRAVILGGAGGLVMWFSHPAVFILGALAAVLLEKCLSKKDRREIISSLIAVSFWLVSFGLLYLFSFRKMGMRVELKEYWSAAFMPLPPKSFSDLLWFPLSFRDFFLDPGDIRYPGVGLVAFILGGYAFFRKQRPVFLLLLMPFLFALLASGLHKYPFEGRVILFLSPLLYLVCARGLQFLFEQSWISLKIIGALLAALLILHPVQTAGKCFVYRMASEEIKSVLSGLQKKIQPEDRIYLYYGAGPAFHHYAKMYGLDQYPLVEGCRSRTDWLNYLDDLEVLRNSPRVWVIFSHVFGGEEEYISDYLDMIGRRLDKIKAYGACAYLFNLQKKSPGIP